MVIKGCAGLIRSQTTFISFVFYIAYFEAMQAKMVLLCFRCTGGNTEIGVAASRLQTYKEPGRRGQTFHRKAEGAPESTKRRKNETRKCFLKIYFLIIIKRRNKQTNNNNNKQKSWFFIIFIYFFNIC